MESLRITHNILLKERTSTIRRGLLDVIDCRARLIAIKGSRGVGKTNFLLAFCKEHYEDDPSCLYVNINNLFFATEGLFHFVERFYKLGGKVLLLDQVHKYPNWDKELREAYDHFPELRIVFTASSIVRIKSNKYLQGIVEMYNLSGLSFREFLELETGHKFPVFAFEEILEHHEEIVEDILARVRPLAHFGNYLKYGYYPIYLEEKSHIDYLLKNINLTLEFDIPYNNQIELKYLTKLKQLLYIVANDNNNVNISKLSHEIGVSRATVLNYLHYMKNARLLTLLFDKESDDENGLKPNQVYLHNPNLLNAVCLDNTDAATVRKTFLVSQLCPIARLNYSENADFLVNGRYDIVLRQEGDKRRIKDNLIIMTDMIERGKKNIVPLWLTGFVY
ncbi:AAA family ATPase [uncultured Sanguibacteroides sp.]|uniref:AAA family ATPase n=1 Tax=uncultured Sanguibacteroides sp. TaxID=1635151 RepID=UPI0025D5AE9B|nr:AAA family ATPase [uncultured Sanguibacteroides sp.]